MRSIRLSALFLICTLVVAPSSTAQIGNLLKKSKAKAEKTLNKKANEELDKQTEKLISGLWDEAAGEFGDMLVSAMPKAKTSVDLEKGVIRREGMEDLRIRDNTDKPTDAEYVHFITVSVIHLPAQLAKLSESFGNATVEDIHLLGDKKMSGQVESAVLTDLSAQEMVTIDREAGEYWRMGFAEMMNMTAGLMDSLKGRTNEVEPRPESSDATDQSSYEMDAKVTVKRGKKKKVRGIKARQHIVIVETVARSKEDAEEQGKFYMIMDLWTAEDFGGSATLADYNSRLGESMMNALGESNLDSKLNFSAFGDPRMSESLKSATEKLSEIRGTPIESNSYFVVGPIDKKLDLDAVLKGKGDTDVRSFSGVSHDEPVNAQSTMFSTTTFITNLNTTPFEASAVSVPADYKEIESPMKQFMQ